MAVSGKQCFSDAPMLANLKSNSINDAAILKERIATEEQWHHPGIENPPYKYKYIAIGNLKNKSRGPAVVNKETCALGQLTPVLLQI